MASADEPEDLQAKDPDDDLEPSRFLLDDAGKRSGWLARLNQNRFFVVFIACSVVFHAGLIWMLQSFDLPSVIAELKVLEIPVELVSEGQAKRGQSGQPGADDKSASPPSGKSGDSGKEAKQEPPKETASQNRPPEAKPEKPPEPPVKSVQEKPVQDKPAENKSAEAKPAADKPPEPDQKPQSQKETVQKPPAPAPAKPEEQKPPAPQQAQQPPPSAPEPAPQTSTAASPGSRLPMFYRPSDRLSLAIPAPLPMDDPDAEAVSYKVIVFGLLERVKEFPQSARERHATGHVVIAFSIDDKGQPQNVAVVRPSGEADLDEEALAMIGRAAPFPAPPVGAQRDFAVDIGFGGQ